LTDEPRKTAAAFVKKFSIPWPSGYETSRKALAKFKTIRRDPGFPRATPTLYLIDPNGAVLWNDGRSRYLHRDPKALIRELEREIEKALKASSL
jgi:hypothetical protein